MRAALKTIAGLPRPRQPSTQRTGFIGASGQPASHLFGAQSVPTAAGHTYLDARQRGLDQTLAVIHAAHKANRLCFALLREQRLYRPVSLEEQARFHHRWQAFHKKGRRRRRPQHIAA